MFSIGESLKYGWSKFKDHLTLSLLTTLFMLAAGSLMSDKKLGAGTFLLSLALTVLLIVVRIGYTKIFLRIHDGETPKFVDIFKEYKVFWRYLGLSILSGLAVLGGLILLILPGIYWAVRFSFGPIIIVDTNSGPVVSMKESYAITKDKFWQLFGFWVAIIALNILGIIALFVGLLVTIPVSTLATIYVYRILTQSRASIAPETTSPQVA